MGQYENGAGGPEAHLFNGAAGIPFALVFFGMRSDHDGIRLTVGGALAQLLIGNGATPALEAVGHAVQIGLAEQSHLVQGAIPVGIVIIPRVLGIGWNGKHVKEVDVGLVEPA